MVTTTTFFFFFFPTKCVRGGIIFWGYNLFDVLREMGVTERTVMLPPLMAAKPGYAISMTTKRVLINAHYTAVMEAQENQVSPLPFSRFPSNRVRKSFLSIQLSAVMFYAQERQYRHMHTCLLDLLRRFGSDPVLLFWRAFSIVLEGMP